MSLTRSLQRVQWLQLGGLVKGQRRGEVGLHLSETEKTFKDVLEASLLS